MSTRHLRTAVLSSALSCLLCAAGASPAYAAAVPRSWEADALGLSSAHRISQGEGVTVAVLDSGVQADHPALRGKVTTGPDYLEDGAGPGSPLWGGHGTAMASDVLKAAPKAKILSVRVIDDSKEEKPGKPGQKSPVARGVEYAIAHGADVISMSLGGGSSAFDYDTDDTAALGKAASKGIPALAAAGNEGDMFNEAGFPAGYPSVLTVAATQQGGTRAPFSTVRTYNTLAAPGVGIQSAKKGGGTKPVNGTSPATALASGVVATMLSHNPKLTPAQVRAVLTRTADHPSGGRNALVGYGQINADRAVKAAAMPPTVDTGPVAYRGKKHLVAPDGIQSATDKPLEVGPFMTGLGMAAAGAAMVFGCIKLNRRSRRSLAAG